MRSRFCAAYHDGGNAVLIQSSASPAELRAVTPPVMLSALKERLPT